MNIVLSFTSLCLLLILGKVLRIKIKILQKLYLPSSVIAGILGLTILQVFGNNLPAGITAGWNRLPGFLINIVFASLFLGITIPPLSKIWKKSGPQLAYGQIVAWGQYFVGIGIALLILVPLFKIPGYFGVIIPVGFEGGHGTAAGLKEIFNIHNWPEGGDLALASATTGIVSAIIVGMVLINWAVRKKITATLKDIQNIPENNLNGIFSKKERPVAGYQTVFPESIDSLGFHLSIIGIAILIGYLLLQLLFLTKIELFRGFPLFPLCMIGGVLIQVILTKFSKQAIIDRGLSQRISGTALDFLVVAAIACIRLPVIMNNIWPFLIIVLAGILWNVFCVMFLARRLLPDAWFERAIAEMGQSMGVTATGLLLLRVTDSKNETGALSAFGYKQLLHEPFMGGGLWTSLAIPLAITHGPWIVFIISISAIIGWLIIWRVLFYKKI